MRPLTLLQHVVVLVVVVAVFGLLPVNAAEMETVEFELNDPRHPKNIYMANHAFDRRDRKMGGFNAGEGRGEVGVDGLQKGLKAHNAIRADPRNQRLAQNGGHAVVPGKVGANSPVAGISPRDYYAHVERRDKELAESVHQHRRRNGAKPVRVIGEDDAAKIAEVLAGYDNGGGDRYGEREQYRRRVEQQARVNEGKAELQEANRQERGEALEARALGAKVDDPNGQQQQREARPKRGGGGSTLLDAQQIVRKAKYSCRKDVINMCLSAEDIAADHERAKANMPDHKIRLRKRIQGFEACLSRPQNIHRITNAECARYIQGRAGCLEAATSSNDRLCHMYIENRTSYHQAKKGLAEAQNAVYLAIASIKKQNLDEGVGGGQPEEASPYLQSQEWAAFDKYQRSISKGYMLCIRAVRDGTYLADTTAFYAMDGGRNRLAVNPGFTRVVTINPMDPDAPDRLAQEKQHTEVAFVAPKARELEKVAESIKEACSETDFYDIC